MRSFSESYRAAGVDIEAGYKGVKLMQHHVARTVIPGVVSDLGGFGGLFAPNLSGMKEPVLVSGTDGVGTKQRIILPSEKTSRKRWHRWSPAWRRAASGQAAP